MKFHSTHTVSLTREEHTPAICPIGNVNEGSLTLLPLFGICEGLLRCCKEITWDAGADFESGIGRPLFQGLSYHNTPEGPPPEIRYLDASAKPGEKPTHSILIVNSAGVPSEPSAGVIVPSPESGKE